MNTLFVLSRLSRRYTPSFPSWRKVMIRRNLPPSCWHIPLADSPCSLWLSRIALGFGDRRATEVHAACYWHTAQTSSTVYDSVIDTRLRQLQLSMTLSVTDTQLRQLQLSMTLSVIDTQLRQLQLSMTFSVTDTQLRQSDSFNCLWLFQSLTQFRQSDNFNCLWLFQSLTHSSDKATASTVYDSSSHWHSSDKATASTVYDSFSHWHTAQTKRQLQLSLTLSVIQSINSYRNKHR